jgi:hypothetical protein
MITVIEIDIDYASTRAVLVDVSPFVAKPELGK